MQRQILEPLKKWMNASDRKPLILKGARQIGKTFSLKKFGELCFKQTHYFNFEKQLNLHSVFEKDFEPQRIVKDLSFVVGKSISENDLIIFDEIQSCPKALNSLKYFSEDMAHLKICAAGSLLGVHIGAEPFPVGAVHFLNMYPMSFEEFLLAMDEKQLFQEIRSLKYGNEINSIAHEKLLELLKVYYVTGGLPAAVKEFRKNKSNLFIAFQNVRSKQEDLLLSYYADMAKHSGKTNSMHIERILKNIPGQLMQVTEGSAHRFSFKDLGPGLSRFSQAIGPIDWLEKAGLIYKVPICNQALSPLSVFTKENLFKLYFFDVGLLGCLAGLTPEAIYTQDFGTYKGFIAENFIAQELHYSSHSRLVAWKENTSEVEFMLEIGKGILPVEVKAGKNTKSKSLNECLKKYSIEKAIVASVKPINTGVHRKLDFVPLYFLTNYLRQIKSDK